MLDHEIKTSVNQYIGYISPDTLTVLEKLDIKEFNKSRKSNGMMSTFARGKLQRMGILVLRKQHSVVRP